MRLRLHSEAARAVGVIRRIVMNLLKWAFCTLTLLGASVPVWAQEAQIYDLGNYVARLYSDGSGSIGKRFDLSATKGCKSFSCEYDRKHSDNDTVFKDTWSFRIKNDEMTDEQKISVRRYPYKMTDQFGEIKLDSNVYLWINLSNAHREVLCVAGHDFPGKTAMIRVDKNDPIETNKNGCLHLSSSLDDQLRKGNTLIIRGYHWPFDGAETREVSLGGYIKTTEFLRARRQ